MDESNILANEAALKIIKDARDALEALGIACVVAPMSLPQGMSISLHAGMTIQQAMAAQVAATIGGSYAHESRNHKIFDDHLAGALADDSILKAAYKPL
ncbi:hypothetical protein [Flavobacterium sp.]|uniref:hypothetical protein n=1 Tax=Flavobacterium sp. TaxID=239 RepID=UPI002627E26F|nr:hypothetical protein [Flavobacterium sp.]